jgi:(2Fe-2S) ferredoxin
MANPEQLPPPVMAPKFGIGRLSHHVFVCLGPDCCAPEDGQRTWDYFKKRLKELNLTTENGTVYRTKCQCLRICTAGPIAVVYPDGTWYQNVNVENIERIIQQHLIGGRVVEDICFARDRLAPAHCTQGAGGGVSSSRNPDAQSVTASAPSSQPPS